ncbi:phosphonate C-P lyase system protein PhnG [Acerihabitans arboris]|uniref:Phosphonate C-P lyase system protein PhnG n=1 Tax=Acerihabitans arboris TaxID=2691583 RepID=A0A845SME6_9GAMM|nr:phosphonate C-P lyase system protein PhnG [Acerihabitans arboris]NDL63791.1 phosphonate C-P lyase system protein PhnG [Acerihabitans arboris]
MVTQQQRQRWMSVLASSPAGELQAGWRALDLNIPFHIIRAPETGLTQLIARMGATGRRFVLGDMTITRAVVRLDDGTYGYSYVAGRDKTHAELCALADALLQQPQYHARLQQQLVEPLAARQQERHQSRAREIAASRVDFFTLVRGDN